MRTNLTAFVDAKRDLDEAILLMSRSGEAFNGMARYREYPDAFVQRGLAREGLRDWAGAVADYEKAIAS